MTVFTFDDLERMIDDCNFEGAYLDWFREIWKMVEKHNLNRRSGYFDTIRFYRLAHQLCALYLGFTNVLFDWGSPYDLDIYLDIDYTQVFDSREYDEDCVESVREHIMSLIEEENFLELEELFRGVNRGILFASLYYCLNSEKFSFDEDKEALDEILNDIDPDKMTAYTWLCEELGN